MIKQDKFLECKDSLTLKFNICTTPKDRMVGKKSYDHLDRCRKSIDKIWHTFEISQQIMYRKMYHNIIKDIYFKPIVDIILNN